MTPTPAELALRVLAMHHEVHRTIDRLIRARTRSVSSSFGPWLEGRLGRLTDKDRMQAFVAIAAEVGRGDEVANVAGVLGTVKQTRDRLAHAAFLHSTDEQQVRGVHDQRVFDIPSRDLEMASWRLLWVLEHVLLVEELTGTSPGAPFQYVRMSFTGLADAPPSPQPPRESLMDPVRIPRFLEDTANAIQDLKDLSKLPRYDLTAPEDDSAG